MRRAHSFAPQTLDVAVVLGLEVARARRARRWTAAQLADRAGVSVTTLRKVEQGDPTVALGIAFEVAGLVGVELFATDRTGLAALIDRGRDRLALLPSRVRKPAGDIEVDDDF